MRCLDQLSPPRLGLGSGETSTHLHLLALLPVPAPLQQKRWNEPSKSWFGLGLTRPAVPWMGQQLCMVASNNAGWTGSPRSICGSTSHLHHCCAHLIRAGCTDESGKSLTPQLGLLSVDSRFQNLSAAESIGGNCLA